MDGRIEFKNISNNTLNRIIEILKDSNKKTQLICNPETGKAEEEEIEVEDNCSLYIY